jgi:hypothetical protein
MMSCVIDYLLSGYHVPIKTYLMMMSKDYVPFKPYLMRRDYVPFKKNLLDEQGLCRLNLLAEQGLCPL